MQQQQQQQPSVVRFLHSSIAVNDGISRSTWPMFPLICNDYFCSSLMLCTHFSSKRFMCVLNACKPNIHGSISALLTTLTTVLMLQKRLALKVGGPSNNFIIQATLKILMMMMILNRVVYCVKKGSFKQYEILLLD